MIMEEKGLVSFLKENFGDGSISFDLQGNAPQIIALVVDAVVLFAEYRVFKFGNDLTSNVFFALGFVFVSAVPFLIGQLAFVYKYANGWQKGIGIIMVALGLAMSTYFGYSELLFGSTGLVNEVSAYNALAFSTALFIALGLFYVLRDDKISTTIKHNRVMAKLKQENLVMKLKVEAMENLNILKDKENELRNKYGGDAVDEYNRSLSGKTPQPVMASDTEEVELKNA